MTTIPSLLARLTAAAPGVCVVTFGGTDVPHYRIGDYEFWEHYRAGFVANLFKVAGYTVEGQPALDWLQGALRAAIEAIKGIDAVKFFTSYSNDKICKHCELNYYSIDKNGNAQRNDYRGMSDNSTEALLAAFVSYCEGEAVTE